MLPTALQRRCFLALLLLHGIPTNLDGSVVDWSAMCRHFSAKQAYDVTKVRALLGLSGSEKVQEPAVGLSHLLRGAASGIGGSDICFLLVLLFCPAVLAPCLQYGALLMTRVAAAASGSTEPSGESSCL